MAGRAGWGLGWGGWGRDVTTHLLVALDKARKGEGEVRWGEGGGGRKRRAHRYDSFAEQGEAPCYPPTQTAPLPPSPSSHAQLQKEVPSMQTASAEEFIHLHHIPGWTGRLRKKKKPQQKKNGRHSAPPTVTHGDMLQQVASLRQRGAAQTKQRGAEHIGVCERVEDVGVASTAASVWTARMVAKKRTNPDTETWTEGCMMFFLRSENAARRCRRVFSHPVSG